MTDQEGGSWLVTVTTQDRPGVIAQIANRLHELGCCVVVASTEIVVGQVSVMMIASATCVPLGTDSISVALVDLYEGSEYGVHVVPIPERLSKWPQPGAKLYRLRYVVEEQVGAFHALTERIAEPDVPLWACSTWVEGDSWCHGDLVVAPSAEVDADALGNSLYKQLERLGRRRIVSWRRLEQAPPPAARELQLTQRGIAISVVGFARPGFVCGALELPANRRMSITGSAMAILGAYTGLLMVVEDDGSVDPQELAGAIQDHLRDHDERAQEPFESHVSAWRVRSQPGPRWPVVATHMVRCEAEDPMGMLAAAAALVAGRDANIVRARTEWHETEAGEPSFAIELAVALPAGSNPSEFDAELAQVATTLHWEQASIQSVDRDPDDVRVLAEPASTESISNWLDELATATPLQVTIDPVDDIRAMRVAG